MKVSYYFVVAVLFLLLSSFRSEPAPNLAAKYSIDYECTIENDQIKIRFETQFQELFKDVYKVDAHFNESNKYYYVVYGIDQNDQEVAELFKTSEYEVQQGIYDYIAMPKAGFRGAGFCKEFSNITELQNNGWCARQNTGPNCAYWLGNRCGYPF